MINVQMNCFDRIMDYINPLKKCEFTLEDHYVNRHFFGCLLFTILFYQPLQIWQKMG